MALNCHPAQIHRPDHQASLPAKWPNDTELRHHKGRRHRHCPHPRRWSRHHAPQERDHYGAHCRIRWLDRPIHPPTHAPPQSPKPRPPQQNQPPLEKPPRRHGLHARRHEVQRVPAARAPPPRGAHPGGLQRAGPADGAPAAPRWGAVGSEGAAAAGSACRPGSSEDFLHPALADLRLPSPFDTKRLHVC